MKVIILTMFEKLFDGDSPEVVFPGDDGEFSVWDFHQPCLYSLRKGRIIVSGQRLADSGQTKRVSFPIRRGMVKIESNKLTAMVEI